MGFKTTIISLDEDRKFLGSQVYIYTNKDEFHTDVFKYLISQDFFRFDKISEIKEIVEKLKFKNNKTYEVYGYDFIAILSGVK